MTYLEIILNIVFPIMAIIIPVFATVYTVNKRIKTQTRESHQPYLILERINNIDKVDEFKYHLTLIGRNYEINSNIEDIMKLEQDDCLNLDFILKNIGYGVATNIKFYNLLTGLQLYGSQKNSDDQNQQLYTTFDIGANIEKSVSANLIYNTKEVDGIIESDHNRVLCVYKDLHNNIYSFLIIINVKSKNHYDYFAYQPSSLSYKKWIKENKINYKVILKKYMNL